MKEPGDERTFGEAMELRLSTGYISGGFSYALEKKERLIELDLGGFRGESTAQIRMNAKNAIVEILKQEGAELSLDAEELPGLDKSAFKMAVSSLRESQENRPAIRAHQRETWYAAFRIFNEHLMKLTHRRVMREGIERSLIDQRIAHVRHSDLTRLLIHEINTDEKAMRDPEDIDVPMIIGIPSMHKPENPAYVLLKTDYYLKEYPWVQLALRFLDN